MVMDLQNAPVTFADKMMESQLRIFNSSASLRAADMTEELTGEDGRQRRRAFGSDEELDSEDDSDNDDLSESDDGEYNSDDDNLMLDTDADTAYIRRKVPASVDDSHTQDSGSADIAFAESDSDLGGDDDDDYAEEGASRWRDNIVQKASAGFSLKRRVDLMGLVYGSNVASDTNNGAESSDSNGEHAEEDGGLFTVKKASRIQERSLRLMDTSKVEVPVAALDPWAEDGALESLRGRFITAPLAEPTNKESTNEDAVYGDFEDLETGEKVHGHADVGAAEEAETAQLEDLAKRKEQLKRKFDAEYDGSDDEESRTNMYEGLKEEMQRQQRINQEEFADDDPQTRAMVEGYRPGTYVRIVLRDMPCEFIENFDPMYPVIIGGLLPSEETFGFMQVSMQGGS